MTDLKPPETRKQLLAFIRESNRIEGITRAPTKREIDAHERFLAADEVSVDTMQLFVLQVAGRLLRDMPGANVYVGNHRTAPLGGPAVRSGLEAILRDANYGFDPHELHVAYETLHPFMDGNGRSGRVLWLWMMLKNGSDPYALKRGFLHTFYYQTLAASNDR